MDDEYFEYFPYDRSHLRKMCVYLTIYIVVVVVIVLLHINVM